MEYTRVHDRFDHLFSARVDDQMSGSSLAMTAVRTAHAVMHGASSIGRTRPDGDCRGSLVGGCGRRRQMATRSGQSSFPKAAVRRSSAALSEIIECSELLRAGRHCSGTSSSGL